MSPGICDEDEYVLLLQENQYVQIFDSQGNDMGRCRAFLDDYQWAVTVDKDALVCYADGKTWKVFSMEKLDTVLEFPEERYSVYNNGTVCLVTDLYEENVSLYNHRGEFLFTIDTPGFSKDRGDCARILDLEDGYLIGVSVGSEEDEENIFPLVWVSTDGAETKEITDSYVTKAFRDYKISCGFGSGLLIYDWDTDTSAVYSLDGEVLLDGLASSVYPYSVNYGMFDWNSYPAFVTRWEDGLLGVYDSDLQFLGYLASEDPYPGYASGFLQGFSYEELGGNQCTSLVGYNSLDWVPCAETDGGCLVSAFGELLRIPLSAGEELISLNDTYMVIQRMDMEGNYENDLVDRKTGERLVQGISQEDHSRYFTLGKGCCIIHDYDQSEGYSVEILDNQKQTCYASDKAYCQVWKNGYILLERGIYRGIADRNGNWVARTLAGWSE